ncbi:MAG: 4Fe-4S binding protein [Candidatus Cloacimonetes bacterium]|nr:4Fe-4S binding protein [Candidatus Cloacimonadota bacterium]MCF7815011.1 4Fe-4S binding protein [Candidatus Cloacimonadota bacterium]MCF7869268.1 4Fe-4S binding protein [Candidatus Cloacimonadota bacterium]
MDKHKLRKLFQTVFFGIWFVLLLLIINGVFTTAHQFCPFASVCFGAMTLNGYFAYIISAVIGLIIAISTIFIGRKFCGYLCFFGTLQEWIYNLRKTKTKFTQLIPFKLHRILIKLKYLILLITIVSAYLGVQYFYMKFCPVLNLAFPSLIGIAGVIILVIIIIGGFFIERIWCRYLCPYAALMNIFEFLGKLFKIRRTKVFRNVKTSINCFNCANYCPMYIDIGYNEEITDLNCIHCYRCVRKCSKEDAAKSECIYRD